MIRHLKTHRCAQSECALHREQHCRPTPCPPPARDGWLCRLHTKQESSQQGTKQDPILFRYVLGVSRGCSCTSKAWETEDLCSLISPMCLAMDYSQQMIAASPRFLLTPSGTFFFPMATMEQPADTEAALFASIPKTSQVCGFITSSRARKTAKYCYHKLVAGLCGINEEEDGSDDDDNVDS